MLSNAVAANGAMYKSRMDNWTSYKKDASIYTVSFNF